MISIQAPAKINWNLHVLGKRPDGFHNISTLIQTVSLYDSMTLELSEKLELHSDMIIPVTENLVYTAALRLKEASGIKTGASITLNKSIPLQAGLGGGSSDAASAIMGLCRLWGTDLPETELFRIASSIGSDVPFFLKGPCAIVEGRGERIRPLNIKTAHTLLLVRPDVGVPTGNAYSMVKNHSKNLPDIDEFVRAINESDYIKIREMSINDLAPAVIDAYPEIKHLREKMLDSGAILCALSGSGSALFGLFKNHSDAEAARLRLNAHWAYIVKTII